MNFQTKLPIGLIAAAGMLLAQAPQPPAGPAGGLRPGQGQGQRQMAPQAPGGAMQRAQGPAGPQTRLQGMTQQLKLTAEQQQKARTLFRAESNALMQAHRQARNAKELLQDSVRAGTSDAEIDRLAQAAGAAQGQVEALHVKTMTKFYAMLTQDQKDLFDERGGRGRAMGPGGRGGGMGGGMRMRGGPEGPGDPGGPGIMRGPGGPGMMPGQGGPGGPGMMNGPRGPRGPRPPLEEDEVEQ